MLGLSLRLDTPYILGQYKDPDNEALGVNIVSCDLTTFKIYIKSYSPFDAELAALHWCITKEDFLH